MNKAQTLAPYAGVSPKLADNVFVAPNASVIGDVKIGQGSSIWYGAVLRGKINFILLLSISIHFQRALHLWVPLKLNYSTL